MNGYVRSVFSDPLQENYLALYIAIVYPYTLYSEEVFQLMRHSLDRKMVAAGILRDAFKVLRTENMEDPKLKAELGEDWAKAKVLADLAEQYDMMLRMGRMGEGHSCYASLEVRPERGKRLYGR